MSFRSSDDSFLFVDCYKVFKDLNDFNDLK